MRLSHRSGSGANGSGDEEWPIEWSQYWKALR
jgi:hypothetical protein